MYRIFFFSRAFHSISLSVASLITACNYYKAKTWDTPKFPIIIRQSTEYKEPNIPPRPPFEFSIEVMLREYPILRQPHHRAEVNVAKPRPSNLVC